MKYGIKINNIEEDLKGLDKYDFVYFGSEFCERKIPNFEFCKKVFEFCNKNNKIPVLLTPYLTDKGINTLKDLISRLHILKKDFEITINDFGMIYLLKEFPEIKINCGRLLIKMKKGPEIMSGALNQSPEMFKDSSLSNNLFIDFMKNNGIKRFETDLPHQRLNLPNEKITAYLGNIVISTTRRCNFIDCEKEMQYQIKDCEKECLKYCVVKNTEFHDELIYVMGNAEFLKSDKDKNSINNDNILEGKFDRIVEFQKITKVL